MTHTLKRLGTRVRARARLEFRARARLEVRARARVRVMLYLTSFSEAQV